jgi:predicted MFS family arabinose efflux permease
MTASSGPPPTDLPPLWTSGFVIMMVVSFLAYANMAIFFQFYEYLQTLPIHPDRYGLLIGIFSAVPLILRPAVSPFVNTGNARPFLYLGAVMIVIGLVAYHPARGFAGLLLVRAFHGLAFVVMGTALTALIIEHIPPGRSSQAFGYIGIVVMLPTTVIPPAVPYLSKTLGGFTNVLILFAGVTLLIFPLMLIAGRQGDSGSDSPGAGRLSAGEVWADLKDVKVLVLLAGMFMLYSGNALVFFFLAGYAKLIGVTGAGFFFTMATCSEIGVRILAGTFFDRLDKSRLIAGAMVGLGLGYAAVAQEPGTVWFFTLGAILGLGWGIALPVYNGLMFDVSAPRFRALNTNLGFQMYQAGFFLGPIIGGSLVADHGFPVLFYLAAVLSLLGAVLIFLFLGGKPQA